MSSKDIFWTDINQAGERLNNSVVLYDGQPVFIQRVEEHDDGDVRAYCMDCADRTKSQRKKLNSPKFSRFRELPQLGWVNPAGDYRTAGALFLARVTQTARTHGLTSQNVSVANFRYGAEDGSLAIQRGNYGFGTLMFDTGFVDGHNGKYPSLEEILRQIKDGSAIAFSRKWAVVRDYHGIKWLYRETQRVGLFTGADTLNLFSKTAYLREEIMSDKAVSINTIREF